MRHFTINSRVVYSVLFYILVMTLILIAKPSLMFDKKGEVKRFGIGDDKTMFSVGVLTALLAIISFYIFCIIDIVFKPPIVA